MKKIIVFGSTGSVGKNILEVISKQKGFEVTALSAHSNIEKLKEQIFYFKPKIVAVYDKEKAKELKRSVRIPVVSGKEGLLELTEYPSDLTFFSMSGNEGLAPCIQTIEKKIPVALANKEILVSAGSLVMELAQKHNVPVLPVDSEHNAIFQCLKNEKAVRRLILTASGGPFFKKNDLEKITAREALNHPTYKMGKKISVDSSTLMNKGLEVIEAHFLFGTEPEKIEVTIHPQSIIHSMVEFADSSIIAQASYPDMKLPIHYALHYPERKPFPGKYFDFSQSFHLDFYPPDFKKFPCLQLAYDALKIKKSMPCFMNAANEVLVDRFLKKGIFWKDIAGKLEKLMVSHSPENVLDLNAVLEIEKIAKEKARII